MDGGRAGGGGQGEVQLINGGKTYEAGPNARHSYDTINQRENTDHWPEGKNSRDEKCHDYKTAPTTRHIFNFYYISMHNQ